MSMVARSSWSPASGLWSLFAPGPLSMSSRPPPDRDGDAASRILVALAALRREGEARQADPRLDRNVSALKAYQQRRLENSYADLLADRRHARAIRFLIDELQGRQDFAGQDRQIAGLLPALAAVLPDDAMDTAAALTTLHALCESLDMEMARHLAGAPVTRRRYIAAWRATGRAPDRQRQVELTLLVGRRLDSHTRDPLLGISLQMMRGPALLAGLGGLHHFLESGFQAFASMGGGSRLLAAIGQRESALCDALFHTGGANDAALASLPGA